MKKHNMFGVLVTTVLTATLALAAWAACGQDTHPGPAPSAAEAVFGGGPRQGSWKVDGDQIWIMIMRPGQKSTWTGLGEANVHNAVKALTELYPNVTFAMDPRVAEKRVGELIDRVNDPLSDLNALRVASGNAFDIRSGGMSDLLFMLEPNSSTLAAATPKPEDRTVECFNLTGYLQPMSTLDKAAQGRGNGGGNPMAFLDSHTDKTIAYLKDIIRHAITDLEPSMQQPHFQFYADGGLLIVTGSKRAIDVAAKVIYALPGASSSPPPPQPPLPAPVGRFVAPVPNSNSTNQP
jgi:hypothetical protein